MVSVEENGKSKKYRTYRDLESLKARKEQTEKLNKGNLSPSLHPFSNPYFASHSTVGTAIWNAAPK